jgi:hypothetical protein
VDRQTDRYTVEEEFLFIGRTFEEYSWMFDLDSERLDGWSVLDCGAGPSSFTATSRQAGIETIAVDPAYSHPVSDLEPVCREAVERTQTQLREKSGLFVWEEYDSVETRVRYLRAAFERFLADYVAHSTQYIAGALPDLPFESDSFDLALSANFLFLYGDRIGLDTHLDALSELARVAREVRLFPLASLEMEQSAYVEPAVDHLRADGYGVEFRTVPYEFQSGVTEMLVVSNDEL